jgi:hypothetical protein
MHHRISAIFVTTLAVGWGLAFSGGCSTPHLGSRTGAEELSQTGPTVLNPRTEPGTFEVTRDLKPLQVPVILAEVKDLTSPISSVRLRFNQAPIDIPMKRVAGTTWRATLTPEQIRMLAVSGKTMKYDAAILAKNNKGLQGSGASIEILVKAPEIDATG